VSSRRHARELALQALYRADITEAPPVDGIEGLQALADDDEADIGSVEGEEMAFTRELVEGVAIRKAEVDGRIEAASLNWRLPRMPVVDRNILRLATWELLACDETPVSVVINEAVELAKRFGGADSRSFVNGILDRIAFELGRGGRGPRREG
jgi:transcription antitermination protein NusB